MPREICVLGEQRKSRGDNLLIDYWGQTWKVSMKGKCIRKDAGDRQEIKQVTAFQAEARKFK